MANVPPELFNRKATHRALEKVEEQLDEYVGLSIMDNHSAVMAGYNDLAASVLRRAGREDLAEEFDRKRDELVAQAQDWEPLRKQPKPKPGDRRLRENRDKPKDEK